MECAIVVYDGFDDLDALGPHEVFGHVTRSVSDLEVGLYTMEEQAIVESSHGLRIEPDGTLPQAPDVVIVPGGGWSARDDVGARGEAERGALPNAVERLHEHGTTVAAVCTGGMILAEAGLTDGRPAVTHHSAIEDLRESGAEVVEARVVDDGDVLTAGGITAGIDLALHLLEREFGDAVARQVTEVMEYDRRGEIVSA